MRVVSISRDFTRPADTITLDETARHRRRMRFVSDNGISFMLDLPEARRLRHGDGLELDDGRVIEVRAVPEALYEICGRNNRHTLILAWQLGNRHLPAQIIGDRIRIRRDHVIRDMLHGLAATVTEIEAPFDPEGGAYDTHNHGDGSEGPGGHSHD